MHGFRDRALALVFAAGVLLFGAAFANAGPYEDALAGLTTDSFSDTANAINAPVSYTHLTLPTKRIV